MRRLLRIRNLEEEQERLALESALGELRQLENALKATVERAHRGRVLVGMSARSGELPDRLAGLEETRAAARHRDVLTPRIADAELDVAALRQEYLARRIERRQAETLIEKTEAQDAVEAGRRGQQALDDWFGNKVHQAGAGEEPSESASSETEAKAAERARTKLE
jgi:flagellar export protein FliJ